MKRKTKENEMKVTFKFAEDMSEEKAQRRLNAVFDILFDKTIKNWQAKQKITNR